MQFSAGSGITLTQIPHWMGTCQPGQWAPKAAILYFINLNFMWVHFGRSNPGLYGSSYYMKLDPCTDHANVNKCRSEFYHMGKLFVEEYPDTMQKWTIYYMNAHPGTSRIDEMDCVARLMNSLIPLFHLQDKGWWIHPPQSDIMDSDQTLVWWV